MTCMSRWRLGGTSWEAPWSQGLGFLCPLQRPQACPHSAHVQQAASRRWALECEPLPQAHVLGTVHLPNLLFTRLSKNIVSHS